MVESKLNSISSVIEKEHQIQQNHQEQLNQLHIQQQEQSQVLQQQQQHIQTPPFQPFQPTISQLPPQIVLPAPLKGLIFSVTNGIVMEELPKKENIHRRNLLRTGVIVTFLLGLMTITLGAILLGMVLSNPEQVLTATAIEAKKLKPMDRDGLPDPYCEISIGSHLYRTQTDWNTPDPRWEQTFAAPYDVSIPEVIFQLYDDDPNPYMPPRRMGYAAYDLSTMPTSQTMDTWLTLVPNMEGDYVSGQIHVTLYLTAPRKPGYELVLLFAGVFLTSVSLGLGFYVWRSQKTQKPQQFAVQMS